MDLAYNQKIEALINQLRTEPNSFVKPLQHYLTCIKQNILELPGSEFPIELQEGQRAVSYLQLCNFS